MTKRRLLYWGLPVIGALIGCIRTPFLKIGTQEALDNQVDAFLGASIWFLIITTLTVLRSLS